MEHDGITTETFSGISPNPALEEADAGGARVRAFGPAVVVALGGGSPIDAAKAIALLATNPERRAIDLDYRQTPDAPAVPLIAIPTTAGTGAETNGFGVLADHARGEKVYAGHASCQPRVALLDPELTVGLPAPVTAATGLDVVVHAVESLQARTANPYATALALEALRAAARWLPVAVERGGDLEARSQMLLAAHLATLAFSAGGTGLGTAHALAHAISDRLAVAHGVALATVFAGVVRHNVPERPEASARAARALGAAGDLESGVIAFQDRIGLRPSLGELGAGPDDVEPLAARAATDVVIQNAPRIPTHDELVALLEAAM
jgi:alcohol dehydrogenase